MRPVGVAKKRKKDRNFHASNWLFAQTTHVDISPRNFACGVVFGKYLYISSFIKIGRGVSSCGGSKIALTHWQGPWLIQQFVLPYKPWSVHLYGRLPSVSLYVKYVSQQDLSPTANDCNLSAKRLHTVPRVCFFHDNYKLTLWYPFSYATVDSISLLIPRTLEVLLIITTDLSFKIYFVKNVIDCSRNNKVVCCTS